MVLGACGSAPTPTEGPVIGNPKDPRFGAILADVTSDMNDHGVPGAAVAVLLDGHLAFAGGLGVKKAGEAGAVAPTTLFRVASLSKMVLASTAMKLVEEGKLDLSQPVTEYVPLTLEQGYDPSSIRVSQLLDHTAGIPDLPVETICPVGYGQLSAYFVAHGSQPLWTPPGEVWNYSNQGFSVAGWVVEEASGQPFEEAVAARVFGPAQMASATYDPTVAMAADHAVGTNIQNGVTTYIEPDAYDCEATRPAGGVMASVLDYAHFAETLLASGGSMLTPASVTAMETGHVDTDYHPDREERYGYGFFVLDGDSTPDVIYHDGDDSGFHCTLMLVPSRGIGLIVFYNSDSARLDVGAKAALAGLLGDPNLMPVNWSTPPSTWGKYAGTYVDPNVFGSINVSLEGANLTASIPRFNISGLSLTQVAGDRFNALLNGESTDVVFYPRADGAPHWFVTTDGVGTRQ
jgi:CubicO group peptidase (beta-lactamase class C family)